MQEKLVTKNINEVGTISDNFPKELIRRRWSTKEIITIVCDELLRDGKLRHRINEIITKGGKK